MRASDALALSMFVLAGATLGCTDDNPDTAELTFRGEQQALPGFTYDTGFLPAGGPIQVRFELTAEGKLAADARGTISDTALVGTAGTGLYTLDSKIKVKAYLKMDVAGKKYNGPLPGAPDMALTFGDAAAFEPFLLGQKVKVTGSFPETKLGTINLAGALSAVPGVKGDLVVSAAGTVNSEFTGICAAVQGDLAQFTGSTSTGGTLTLKPSVEVSLPLGVSKKLAPFDIKIPIPAVVAAMDLGTRSLGGGTVSGKGPCSGATADGGPGKEGGLTDGAPTPTDGAGDGPVDGPPGDVGASDGPPPEQSCTVGTPDNCAFCGDKCLGPDDTATSRACSSGACTIHCKGAYYDVNGKVADGCEIIDPLVQHSLEVLAKDLGSASDCDSAKTTTAALLSDGRYHVLPPHDRKLGTSYWYKLAIADKLCALSATVKVDLASLPKTAKYGVTAHWVCKLDKKVLTSTFKSEFGGKSMTLTPETNCAGFDDSGTLLVRVQKVSGASVHSNALYTLSITP